MSPRRFQDISSRHILKTSLQDVLKTSWRQKIFLLGISVSNYGLLTNLNQYLTNLYLTNLYFTNLRRIKNVLKKTRNSFKKWPLNLWWISNKAIMEVGNITKAAIFESFLHLSYKNTQLLFLWQCFLILSWEKH